MKPNRTTVWALLERCLASLAILFCSGEMILLMSVKKGGEVAEGDASLIRQVVLFSLYAIIFFLLALRWKTAWRTMQRDGLVWVLMLIAIGSIVWSDAPSVTMHRSLGLLGTTGFGVYLAAQYSLTGQVRLLAATLAVAGVASMACALLLPDYGTHGEGWLNAWRGIYIHKNTLGRVMMLCSLAMMALIFDHPRRWLPYLGLALSVCLLVLSLSKTALVVVFGVGAIMLVCRAYQKSRLFAAFLLLTAGLVAVLVIPWLISHFDLVTGAIGKDATLTGRTSIWEVVIEKIQKRPWLGYGFYGFWRGWEGESAHVWQVMGLVVAHGHNGYLDICLDMGALGIAVFTLGFTVAFFRAVTWLRRTDTVEGLWPLGFLTLLLIYNCTESSLLKEHNLYWALYVATILSRPRLPTVLSVCSTGTVPRTKVPALPLVSSATEVGA